MGEGGATESLLLVGKLESLMGGFLLLFWSGTRSRKDELIFFFLFFRGSVSGVGFFSPGASVSCLSVESFTAGRGQ